jgi:hypothetical protein
LVGGCVDITWMRKKETRKRGVKPCNSRYRIFRFQMKHYSIPELYALIAEYHSVFNIENHYHCKNNLSIQVARVNFLVKLNALFFACLSTFEKFSE